MKKRNRMSVIFMMGMVLIMVFGGFYETSFAAKKGKVTKIVSDETTGITQEEMLKQEPDFYSLMNKKTKKAEEADRYCFKCESKSKQKAGALSVG